MGREDLDRVVAGARSAPIELVGEGRAQVGEAGRAGFGPTALVYEGGAWRIGPEP
jgi:hypothetical protein